MREIILTEELIAMVDDEDYEMLTKGPKWHCDKGSHTCYATRGVYNKETKKPKTEKMHQLILKPKKGFIIDHINRNGLDNRRCNLRHATRSQNSHNSKMRTNNSSGFKGVFRAQRGEGFYAQITLKYKQKFLGVYKTAELAALVYNKAARELHGEFASLNKVDLNLKELPSRVFKKRQILCHNNNTTYYSISEAASKLGVQRSNISHVLTKKRSHTGGLTFEYIKCNIEGV